MRVLATLFLAIGLCEAWTFSLSSGKSDNFAVESGKHKEKTIAEILRSENKFSKLAKAFERHSNLRDDLDSRDHKYVLFAPTDEAFEHLKHMPKGGSGDIDMENVLQYHLIKEHSEDIADRNNWHDGMLIETKLRESKLGDRNQVMRVTRLFGRWTINVYAQVQEMEFSASNGVIFVLDRVVVPPLDLYAITRILPFELSTWTSAVQECKELKKTLEEDNELTLFAPSNRAWAKLGMVNIVYLFSKAGKEDLMKIVKYHIATSVKYLQEIERSEKLETLLGEEIDVEVVERSRKHGERRRHPKAMHHRSKAERRHIIVDGWSRVIGSDIPAENGALNMVDAVLIPDSVELPEEPYSVQESD